MVGKVENCRRNINVNFNVNFNVLLSKYIVHPLVKIKKTLIISRCTVQLWKFVEKIKTHILCSFPPPTEDHAFYEIMWKNAVDQRLGLPCIFLSFQTFLKQMFTHFVPFPVRVTLSAHLTLFYFIAIKFGEECILRSSSAWIFLYFSLTFSL
jgi:hypothetical protein